MVSYSYVEIWTWKWWTWLAEEISKQSVKSIVWFFLAAFIKMWEEKDGLREELLRKKDDLGNSHYPNYKRFWSQETDCQENCSKAKAKGVAG